MKIFIPLVKHETGEIAGQSFEDSLFYLISVSPYQQRKAMYRHPLLMLAAQRKADDMRDQDYFGHTSPTGVTPNEVIRSTGYVLPDYYREKGNNCESISLGRTTASEVAGAFYLSPGHRVHVYGEDKFYREQECIGVALAYNDEDRTLVVFMSAPCMEQN